MTLEYIYNKHFVSVRRLTISAAFVLINTFCTVSYAKTTLVYTSNQPNILVEKDVAHFPQLGTLLQELRDQPENNTLFFHGGDSFSPSAISLFDKARNIISLANLMDVSLYSVGKRELTYDVDVLSLRALDAQFPIITSNLTDARNDKRIEGLFDNYQFEVDNQTIFVSSLINPRTLVSYAPKHAAITKHAMAMKRIEAQQKGADFKILMTDIERESALKLAQNSDFDLILVAIDGPDESIQINNTTLVLGGGQDGDAVVIELDNHAENRIKVSIANLSDYLADPVLSDFIDKYQQRLGSLYKEKIATAANPFTTQKKLIRTRETALANVFTDALKEFAETDVAILNSGSIRNSVDYSGNHRFTRGDIQREFPFGGYYVAIEISGADLKSMMENALSRIEHVDGRFLNVSGMSVTYNSKHEPGNRVKSVSIAGSPVIEQKLYTLAMQDFFLKGADNFDMLKGKKTINNLFNKSRIWNIVADYFSEKKIIKTPNMGRLKDQASHEN